MVGRLVMTTFEGMVVKAAFLQKRGLSENKELH
jgi:hypothetical protein